MDLTLKLKLKGNDDIEEMPAIRSIEKKLVPIQATFGRFVDNPAEN